MTGFTALPMTGAAAIGPIPTMLSDRVGERAVTRAFDQARLSLAALDTPRAPIPLAGLAQLWEQAAHWAADRTFGFIGGMEMTHATYGLWLEFCISAPTLADALARIPVSLRYHQTGTRFSFDMEGDCGVLRYHPAWRGQFCQHSDHVVGSVIRLIRGFAGPNWHPAWVELDYQRDPNWRALDPLCQCPLRFGAGTTGVAVHHKDLRLPSPLTAPRPLTLGDVAAEAAVATVDEPRRSIQNVVAYRLLEGETDIDGAAELSGVGVQSLQRRLRKSGLTYRQVLAHARRDRAELLLRETNMPISEIAYALGYEDHANFTHAFRRWTGHAPSACRCEA